MAPERTEKQTLNSVRRLVYSDVIIAVGFAIFALSDFPPTQRFGLVVLGGCVVDILANLFVLPLLGRAELKLPRRATARHARAEA